MFWRCFKDPKELNDALESVQSSNAKLISEQERDLKWRTRCGKLQAVRQEVAVHQKLVRHRRASTAVHRRAFSAGMLYRHPEQKQRSHPGAHFLVLRRFGVQFRQTLALIAMMMPEHAA